MHIKDARCSKLDSTSLCSSHAMSCAFCRDCSLGFEDAAHRVQECLSGRGIDDDAQARNDQGNAAVGKLANHAGHRRILKTVGLGMPNAFAILRPLNPCSRNATTSSRCGFTLCGLPSWIPALRARAKPSRIFSAVTVWWNSLMLSRNLSILWRGIADVSTLAFGTN
jgi:hypothetical protein